MKNLLFILLLSLGLNVSAAPILIPVGEDVDFLDLSELIADNPDKEALFALVGAGIDPNTSLRLNLNLADFENGIATTNGGTELIFQNVLPALGGGVSIVGTGVELPDSLFEIAWFNPNAQLWQTSTQFKQKGPDSVLLSFTDPGVAGPQALGFVPLQANLLVTDVFAADRNPPVGAVPLPPSALLFGSGLIGAGIIARRKEKREQLKD